MASPRFAGDNIYGDTDRRNYSTQADPANKGDPALVYGGTPRFSMGRNSPARVPFYGAMSGGSLRTPFGNAYSMNVPRVAGPGQTPPYASGAAPGQTSSRTPPYATAAAPMLSPRYSNQGLASRSWRDNPNGPGVLQPGIAPRTENGGYVAPWANQHGDPALVNPPYPLPSPAAASTATAQKPADPEKSAKALALLEPLYGKDEARTMVYGAAPTTQPATASGAPMFVNPQTHRLQNRAPISAEQSAESQQRYQEMQSDPDYQARKRVMYASAGRSLDNNPGLGTTPMNAPMIVPNGAQAFAASGNNRNASVPLLTPTQARQAVQAGPEQTQRNMAATQRMADASRLQDVQKNADQFAFNQQAGQNISRRMQQFDNGNYDTSQPLADLQDQSSVAAPAQAASPQPQGGAYPPQMLKEANDLMANAHQQFPGDGASQQRKAWVKQQLIQRRWSPDLVNGM